MMFDWKGQTNYVPILLKYAPQKDMFLISLVKTLPANVGYVRDTAWDDPLEEGMATNSSVPAWRIPWTEKPDGLQSMGLQRVGHDWATSLSLYTNLKRGFS